MTNFDIFFYLSQKVAFWCTNKLERQLYRTQYNYELLQKQNIIISSENLLVGPAFLFEVYWCLIIIISSYNLSTIASWIMDRIVSMEIFCVIDLRHLYLFILRPSFRVLYNRVSERHCSVFRPSSVMAYSSFSSLSSWSLGIISKSFNEIKTKTDKQLFFFVSKIYRYLDVIILICKVQVILFDIYPNNNLQAVSKIDFK